MNDCFLSEEIFTSLKDFLRKNKKSDLISIYLFFLEKKFHLNPVVFLREKKIYRSQENVINHLESHGKLYRETEVQVRIGKPSVNEKTKKIYICPYTGRVFADNLYKNPQDAIYEWVSTCPENTDRKNGMRVKKFYVSEDPKIIQGYLKERKNPRKRIFCTSFISGKIYYDRQGVIDDFCKNHLSSISMKNVISQNKFEIEEDFLSFIQKNLEESCISDFLDTLSKRDFFLEYIKKWESIENNDNKEE